MWKLVVTLRLLEGLKPLRPLPCYNLCKKKFKKILKYSNISGCFPQLWLQGWPLLSWPSTVSFRPESNESLGSHELSCPWLGVDLGLGIQTPSLGQSSYSLWLFGTATPHNPNKQPLIRGVIPQHNSIQHTVCCFANNTTKFKYTTL